MRVSIVGVMPNLFLPKEIKRLKFSRISLEKSGFQINALHSQNVEQLIGIIEKKAAIDSPCFYINLFDFPGHQDLAKELAGVRGIVQKILFSMWLVKDNSLHLDTIFGVTPIDVSINRSPMTFTDSEGNYKENYFSKEEIKEAEKWFGLEENLLKGNKGDGSEINRQAEYSIGSFTTHTSKNLVLKSRFNRATRFIIAARSESFLPAKITFYISALESLLSISNNEVRMQVADRGARILGKSYEERLRINKTISIAYTFRSTYIHGARRDEKSLRKSLKFFNNIEELSLEMDEISRKIIKLFLTDLKHVIEMGDEDFAVWVNELLYK